MAARFVVGIDLGTTHTVVAYAPLVGEETPRIFDVPQLVARGEIRAQALFPSCLFAPTEAERVADDPWGDAPWIAGELARARGGEVPGRFVSSAKSWLSHGAVDRMAAILPWGVDDPEVMHVSPVDASARYLSHVRAAWDAAHEDAKLADQEVVLTVPASFDEVARELTVEAAKRAGLRVRLLEEPQAAFYDFMREAGEGGVRALGEGLVLVVDVGGGTTDLSLLRVAEGEITRVAVGRHLLLGGDNMDLALAHACEPRLVAPGEKLDAARFGQLVLACRAAKEQLLTEHAPDDVAVTILGRGSGLFAGTKTTRLARAEVESIVLGGFFPPAPRDARPERARTGLVAFGLPYERDAAITRHVASFFARHAPESAGPSAVLLNGGVFRAGAISDALIASMASWGGPSIERLPNADPDLSVARGAVSYGLALAGRGARIGGGSGRGYYVGISDNKLEAPRAVCVVPRGAEEGATQRIEGRTFALTVGTPVRFDLFASDETRGDRPGDVVTIDEDRFETLPPVATSIDAGTHRGPKELRVALEGELTAIGTLELACVETSAREPRRFRLAFQLRETAPPRPTTTPPPPSIGGARLEQAKVLIARAFESDETRAVKDLLRDLEKTLGERASWTTQLARALFDAIAPHARARRKSADHERVFWLLAGYCVRPGFGDPLDTQRVRTLGRLFVEKVVFADEERNWQQFWIAWRRAAAGLDAAAQVQIRDAMDPWIAPQEAGLKRSKKFKPLATNDMIECAASLERVPRERREALGEWIIERTWTDHDPRLWAAIGRVGARVPAYAGLDVVVAPRAVEPWIERLLREKWESLPTASRAAVHMARVTADRARDVSERLRREVEKRLVATNAKPEWIRAVREHVPVDEAERADFYGEGLPVGLRLVD